MVTCQCITACVALLTSGRVVKKISTTRYLANRVTLISGQVGIVALFTCCQVLVAVAAYDECAVAVTAWRIFRALIAILTGIYYSISAFQGAEFAAAVVVSEIAVVALFSCSNHAIATATDGNAFGLTDSTDLSRSAT